MERWNGKVAVVTGASAGMGLAIAKALVREGMIVVGFARRQDKMLEEMKSVQGPGKFFARKCDISKEDDVVEAFNYIKDSFKTVHVLVNNAGFVKIKTVEEADMKELQQVIDTNFVGLVHCSKQAIKLMKENDHEANIINVNSIAGHKVPNIIRPDGIKLNMNVYSPTKFAVTSLSQVLTNELIGGKIRITNLSPGYVLTDMGADEMEGKIGQKKVSIPYLNPEDIADAVVYVVGAPHHVQITELSIRPLGDVY